MVWLDGRSLDSHGGNTEVGAFSVTLRAPCSTLCNAMIQTHWAAWCLIEPQAVNPRKENQLIQIKVRQTGGNGIVKSTPLACWVPLKIRLITQKPNMLTWNKHQTDFLLVCVCRAVRRFWHNLAPMTACLFVFCWTKDPNQEKTSLRKCVTGLIHEWNFNKRGVVRRCERRADRGLYDSVSRCSWHQLHC